LAVLSRNSDGTLAPASTALKINVANYLKEFKSLSENLNITDAKIINLGVSFSIVSDKTLNQQEILSNCLIKLKDFFDIQKWNIGQSISISMIQRTLTDVKGVLAVPEISFTQLKNVVAGRTYSSESNYVISNRIKNYILQCDSDQIFEVKYANFDISGSIIT
jgi:hypothetical protein